MVPGTWSHAACFEDRKKFSMEPVMLASSNGAYIAHNNNLWTRSCFLGWMQQSPGLAHNQAYVKPLQALTDVTTCRLASAKFLHATAVYCENYI